MTTEPTPAEPTELSGGTRTFARLTGAACAAIGVAHALAGVRIIPGLTRAGATADSLDRFHGVIFAGYGWAWLHAVRSAGDSAAPAVRALSRLLLAGGVARLISWADRGRPQAFQVMLTAVELGVPAAFEVLLRTRGGRGAGLSPA